MKSSMRIVLLGGFGAALLTLLSFAQSFALVAEVTLGSEKVQVVHGTSYNSDTTTMTLDITNHGDPGCDTNDDLIAGGLEEIALSGCSCEDFIWIYDVYCSLPFNDHFGAMVSHTIAGHQYGTFYSNTEPGGAGTTTLSAKATKITPTPMGTCGRWTLNLNRNRAEPVVDHAVICDESDSAVHQGWRRLRPVLL